MTSLCYHCKNSSCSKRQEKMSQDFDKQNLVMKGQEKAKGRNIAIGNMITSVILVMGKSGAKLLILPKNLIGIIIAYFG